MNGFLVGLTAVLVVCVVAVFFALILNPSWEQEPLPAVQRELAALEGTPLAAEKARQETLKLQLENRAAGSRWSLLASYIPLTTAVFAGAGILAAF